MLMVKAIGSTGLGYKRFASTRLLNRAVVHGETLTIRTRLPRPLLRASGLDVPLVVRADEIASVIRPRGFTHDGILVPAAESTLSPILVSWWVCEALVPGLATRAARVGYLAGQRLVRGAVVW